MYAQGVHTDILNSHLGNSIIFLYNIWEKKKTFFPFRKTNSACNYKILIVATVSALLTHSTFFSVLANSLNNFSLILVCYKGGGADI